MGNQFDSQTLTKQRFILHFYFSLSKTHLAQHPASDSSLQGMHKEKHGKLSK